MFTFINDLFQWIPNDLSPETDKSTKNVSVLAGFGTTDVVNDVMDQATQVSRMNINRVN
jgi:hypothetical protein